MFEAPAAAVAIGAVAGFAQKGLGDGGQLRVLAVVQVIGLGGGEHQVLDARAPEPCEEARPTEPEDAQHLGAEDLHELMRAWENVHRMFQAEAHMRSIHFREETRWPGYYFRADKPAMDTMLAPSRI
mgnify:CR=1 FL=1